MKKKKLNKRNKIKINLKKKKINQKYINYTNSVRFRNGIVSKYLSILFNRNYNRIDKLKLILMRNGKKVIAHRLVFNLLILMKEKLNIVSSVSKLDLALSLLEPPFDLRKVKKGGRYVFIPFPCRQNRKTFLGINFFLEGARERKKQMRYSFDYAMFLEVCDILSNKYCYSLKKRADLLAAVSKQKSSIKFLKNF